MLGKCLGRGVTTQVEAEAALGPGRGSQHREAAALGEGCAPGTVRGGDREASSGPGLKRPGVGDPWKLLAPLHALNPTADCVTHLALGTSCS